MEAILEMQKSMANGGLGELPAFVALPKKGTANEISVDAHEVFKKVAVVRDRLIMRAICAQTAIEFESERKKVYADVARSQKALGSLARVMAPQSAIEHLVWVALAEWEGDFIENGARKFGENAKEQAVFTIWTLRRINKLLTRIIESKQPEDKDVASKDRELARSFSNWFSWTLFHFECMTAALRSDLAIPPDVLELVCDGMRGAVNSYGLLRQGLELRVPSPEIETGTAEWTEEDEELLASSMADMEEMDIEDY